MDGTIITTVIDLLLLILHAPCASHALAYLPMLCKFPCILHTSADNSRAAAFCAL
jgi:hypothetical protein